jgi:hypothetical protein
MLNPGSPVSTTISPPRKLGSHGLLLWEFIQNEYRIEDPGGQELLLQCCESADRIGALSERISADGTVIETKNGPRAHPALRDELANRAFICRTLERLGLNLEAVKPVGRPGGVAWNKREDRDGDH